MTATKAKATLSDILLHADDEAARSPLGRASAKLIVTLGNKPEYKNLLNADLVEELMKQEGIPDLVTDQNIKALLAAVQEVCGIREVDVSDADVTAAGDPEEAGTEEDAAEELFAVGDRVRFPDDTGATLEGEVKAYQQGWLQVEAGGNLYNVIETTEGLTKLAVVATAAPTATPPPPPTPPAEAPPAPGTPAQVSKVASAQPTSGQMAEHVKQPSPGDPPSLNGNEPELEALRQKAAKTRESPNGFYQVLFDVPVGGHVFYSRSKWQVTERLEEAEAVLTCVDGKNKGSEKILPLTEILLRVKGDQVAAPAEAAAPAITVTGQTGVKAEASELVPPAASAPPPAEPAAATATPIISKGNEKGAAASTGKGVTTAQLLATLKGLKAELDKLHEERKLMARRIDDQDREIAQLKAERSAVEVPDDLAALIQTYGQ